MILPRWRWGPALISVLNCWNVGIGVLKYVMSDTVLRLQNARKRSSRIALVKEGKLTFAATILKVFRLLVIQFAKKRKSALKLKKIKKKMKNAKERSLEIKRKLKYLKEKGKESGKEEIGLGNLKRMILLFGRKISSIL